MVRAGADGIFLAPRWQDMPGRYYAKGELLGYVTDKAPPLAPARFSTTTVMPIASSSAWATSRAVRSVRITSYNVCYTKLLRGLDPNRLTDALA